MAKITPALAAAAIAVHFTPTGHAQVAALNTALDTITKSAALAGAQDAVQTFATGVSKAAPVTLSAAQLAVELGKFTAVLIALKQPVSPAECMALNAAIAAYSASLTA